LHHPIVRVAIVAESFLPEVNGVTNSVLRVLEHLEAEGHDALVIAPGDGPERCGRARVARTPAVALPVYRSLPVGLPTAEVRHHLAAFRPDVVHLAAPVVLGAAGAVAARRLGIPSVAVYQTDLAGFASRYRLGVAAGPIWSWLRWVHRQATLTLAPSSLAAWDLRRHGIAPVAPWGRGVDLARFHPHHRNELLRRRLAPNGEVLVGYVGRLAAEKQVHQLARLRHLPGTRLVVVGDGPDRARLQRRLPEATFLGFQSGIALSQAVASLDVFVHTGTHETFCQAVQEALAAGVPVVAPAQGGPLELVHHGRTGYLWPPNDPGLLRGAVQALVEDADLRTRLGRTAHESVVGRTWESLGDELLGHYRTVSGLPDPRRGQRRAPRVA
jgi:phosphatidylinositol alpha 1,6-mannosyltransferase